MQALEVLAQQPLPTIQLDSEKARRDPIELPTENSKTDFKQLQDGDASAEGLPTATEVPSTTVAIEPQTDHPPMCSQQERPGAEGVTDFGTEQASRQDSGDAEVGNSDPVAEPTGQPLLPKCFNRFCKNVPSKTVRSRHNNQVRELCKQCQASYLSGLYCSYCQQVYFRERMPDGFEWLECKECDRKTHLHCVKISHRLHIDFSRYVCSTCQKKRKRRCVLPGSETYPWRTNGKSKNIALQPPASLNERELLFKDRLEVLNLLDYFLVGCSYRLALPQDDISRDLGVIRKAVSNPPSDRGDSEVPNGKKKKKKV